jgi:hypothetical protein
VDSSPTASSPFIGLSAPKAEIAGIAAAANGLIGRNLTGGIEVSRMASATWLLIRDPRFTSEFVATLADLG